MPSEPETRLRILYGVNGEGMGHATRSEVVIHSLLAGHDVRVMASGAAFRFLADRLPRVDEIFGPTFAMEEGEIRRWATVRQNLRLATHELPETVRHWIDEVDDWEPDVVVSDFEPLTGVYARLARTPLIAVGNINMLDRCRHDREIIGEDREDFLLARTVAHSMVPGAVEYIVTTYFRPPVARGGTTLVPPIVRPEIVNARPERGDHLVVYSSGDEALIEALRSARIRCLVYGMRGGPEEAVTDGNLELRPRSNEGFIEALRTARGVVAGGGFSLLSEAVYLGKPILSVPLRGQFEQTMNARYTERLGYGVSAPTPTPELVGDFIERIPEFERALAGYEQSGNSIALQAIEDRALGAAAAAPRALRKERRAARRTSR
ncbi:MAG TPA: glycosyltransferase family protein [Solirubrobacterales bacterium]